MFAYQFYRALIDQMSSRASVSNARPRGRTMHFKQSRWLNFEFYGIRYLSSVPKYRIPKILKFGFPRSKYLFSIFSSWDHRWNRTLLKRLETSIWTNKRNSLVGIIYENVLMIYSDPSIRRGGRLVLGWFCSTTIEPHQGGCAQVQGAHWHISLRGFQRNNPPRSLSCS